MTIYLRTGFFLAFLAIFAGTPAFAQTSNDDVYREWVDYRDGEISVDFDQTPVQFALYAIHAKTGFQIVMPAMSEAKAVSFRVSRQALEPAMRSLISRIGYKNFALMYDDTGRPHRAIILGSQPITAEPGAAAAVAKNEPAAQPLSTDERAKLQKELERWNELKQEERGRIEISLHAHVGRQTRLHTGQSHRPIQAEHLCAGLRERAQNVEDCCFGVAHPASVTE